MRDACTRRGVMMRRVAVFLTPALLLAACAAPLPGLGTKTEPPRGMDTAKAAAAGDAGRVSPPISKPAARSIYFDRDGTGIEAQFKEVVEINARYAMTAPAVRIEGHTDDRGSREYNLALGLRRAGAVKSMMTLLGVPAQRIELVSYGEEKPLRECRDDPCRGENRRVDIAYP